MKLLRIGCPQNCPYRIHNLYNGRRECGYPLFEKRVGYCTDPVDFREDCPLEDMEE